MTQHKVVNICKCGHSLTTFNTDMFGNITTCNGCALVDCKCRPLSEMDI